MLENQLHLRVQKSWIVDDKGEMVVDFVGRFEYLQEDMDRLCGQIGKEKFALPHKNSSERVNYRSYYNQSTKEIVAELYKEDIETFSYSFE